MAKGRGKAARDGRVRFVSAASLGGDLTVRAAGLFLFSQPL